MITVRVPATSANMGPGFDSIGIALAVYNTISVEETDSGLEIDILDGSAEFLPRDGRNLVYRAMQRVFNEAGYKMRGLHIVLNNGIPVTRGLGSSSASIVGGILAANEICNARMSRDDIISFAASIEGHPDNTTPAIMGGMVIAVLSGGKAYYQKIPIDGDKIKFAIFLPNFILRTKKARSVIPKVIPHSDGVFNTGRAALLTASMITGNYDNLKIAFDDRLHQQYRKKFISGMSEIFEKAYDCGALGTYVSGAGPAIISLIRAEDENSFSKNMSKFFEEEMNDWELTVTGPDDNGALLI
ncbi:MAG: Homoserine kinase [Firmicutes bacterium ADurb.Bin193]|nr:MAG: Homoserine kinase [Firmicutes bacterium ADurb.Bin193]